MSVLGEEYRKTLNYLGTVSGRNEDKVGKSGLTVEHEEETPYFGEADTVLVCRKLYAQQYDPSCFIDKSCDERWYPEKGLPHDVHRGDRKGTGEIGRTENKSELKIGSAFRRPIFFGRVTGIDKSLCQLRV